MRISNERIMKNRMWFNKLNKDFKKLDIDKNSH